MSTTELGGTYFWGDAVLSFLVYVKLYWVDYNYNYRGIEQFIGRFPEHVNMIKMDDGHSALHIAAANDHLDIVSLLSSLVKGQITLICILSG